MDSPLVPKKGFVITNQIDPSTIRSDIHSESSLIYCSHCKRNVQSTVVTSFNCSSCLFCFCCFGCWVLSRCCGKDCDCQDASHYCPICKGYIGSYSSC